MNFVKFVIVAVVLLSQIEKTSSRPQVMTLQVPLGQTATLVCESNDENHTFFYWHFTDKNLVIGPGNEYNQGKYKLEVLSGSLTVKAMSEEEEGIYECVSRGVLTDDLLIRPVRMVVQTDLKEVYTYIFHMTLCYAAAIILVGTSFMILLLMGIEYAGCKISKTRCLNAFKRAACVFKSWNEKNKNKSCETKGEENNKTQEQNPFLIAEDNAKG